MDLKTQSNRVCLVIKRVLTEQGFQPNQTPDKVIKVNDEVFISKTSHNDLM